MLPLYPDLANSAACRPPCGATPGTPARTSGTGIRSRTPRAAYAARSCWPGAVIMTPISNARGICQASVRQRRSTTSAAPINSVNDTYRLPCVSQPSTGTAPQSRAIWADRCPPVVAPVLDPLGLVLHVDAVHVVVHRGVRAGGHIEIAVALGQQRVERDHRVGGHDLGPRGVELCHVLLGHRAPLIADLLGLDAGGLDRVGRHPDGMRPPSGPG